jgi:hypothetical protein
LLIIYQLRTSPLLNNKDHSPIPSIQTKQKKCSACDAPFSCTNTESDGSCWCDSFPPLFQPDPQVDCLCPDCLKQKTIKKIIEYTSELTANDALNNNKVSLLPKTTKLIEGIDFYIENGFHVFTAWYHLKRGHCCNGGCRHCPY